jgi:hypothetical protein
MSFSILLSCNKIKHNKYDEKLLISVDTLLTKTVEDVSIRNIQISIPKVWVKSSDKILDSLQKNNLSQTNIFKEIIPILAFNDSINKNFCLLSIYNNLESLDSFVEVLQNEITNKLKSDKMAVNYFSNNDLKISQMIIYNVDYINLKLIFQPEKKIYIFEYLVTNKYYKENIKTIESSIGQLKRRK